MDSEPTKKREMQISSDESDDTASFENSVIGGKKPKNV